MHHRSSQFATDGRRVRATALRIAAVLPLLAAPAGAQSVLAPGAVNLDRATPTTLGVQLLVSGDDNRNARVLVKYRQQGTVAWRDALELLRVHPEEVTAVTLPQQFAGSIFNLGPSTTYEIQLTAEDPDGPVAPIGVVTKATRALPSPSPSCARTVTAGDDAALTAALASVQPGDCIQLTARTYRGTYLLERTDTSTTPVVLRGAVNAAGENLSVMDGDCTKSCTDSLTGCHVLNVRGSHIYIESIAFRNAKRGINILNQRTPSLTPSTNVVIRRVTMSDVCVGVLGNAVQSVGQQTDFYVCDNDLTGPIVPIWPRIYTMDGGAYASAAGIQLPGSGHVICHNRIRGFGDAIRLLPDPDTLRTSRATDIYGNDVLSGYDNGLELDYAQGNVRAFRNRFLNTYGTISFQPIYGGPVYAFRNVAVNVVREQLKVARRGAEGEASGLLVFHNTFVSPPLINSSGTEVAVALNLIGEDGVAGHNFLVQNNLFFGRSDRPSLRTASWDLLTDEGLFDYNAYFPDQAFRFGQAGAITYSNLAALQAGTNPDFENHGVAVAQNVFVSGLQPPTSWQTQITGNPDVAVDPASAAASGARVLPNINDGYVGSTPDRGALEARCNHGSPIYGPRPAGIDESNQMVGCEGIVPGGSPLCGAAPIAGCLEPTTLRRTRLSISQRSSSVNGRQLLWDWRPGISAPATFGDPTTTASYYLCIYETAPGGGRRLVSEALIPAGGNDCGSAFGARACWSSKDAGGAPAAWAYRNANRVPHGVHSLRLSSDAYGVSGAYVKLKATGRYLSLPASVALLPPVTVQLRNTQTPTCWDVDFSASHVTTSRPNRFYARNLD
jgi:hypothetical protein